MESSRQRGGGVSSNIRDLFNVIWGEFFGTFIFLFIAFTALQATVTTEVYTTDKSAGHISAHLLLIASAFGGGVSVGIWLFGKISGAMLNPAITIGLLLVGAINPIKAAAAIVSQLVAGICAAAVTKGFTYHDAPLSISNHLSDNTTVVQGLFIEVFLTAILVLVVIMIVVEKHEAGAVAAPLAIGMTLFCCHIVGVSYTGVSVNPARTLGPAILEGFPGYHWIYWIGPLLGSLLAVAVYLPLKFLRKPEPVPDHHTHYDHEHNLVIPGGHPGQTTEHTTTVKP